MPLEYKDYYDILGVGRDADKKELRKAFRRLVREYHPDVNPNDPEAEERFKEINEAHEVLSDPEKRQKYDQFGAEWKQYQQTGGRPGDFDWSCWQSGPPGTGGQRVHVRYGTPEDMGDLFGGVRGSALGGAPMDSKRVLFLFAGLGCVVLVLAVLLGAVDFGLLPLQVRWSMAGSEATPEPMWTPIPGAAATQEVIPTFAPPSPEQAMDIEQSFISLCNQLNPGVVNIQVFVQREGIPGAGAGSGFILDEEGHIVTNHHVVAPAARITVIFYDGTEAEAQLIGSDADSDLAVIRVEELAEGAHPLPLGDSDEVEVGAWVVAIGNPFGLGSSMTSGIVSAVGRTIPSAGRSFGIPEAIQTDAAINPGNSGGPLLNLEGEVIGVNAQIVSGGTQANAGVGFAIPANIARRVTPVLIESGAYQWSWLGVRGNSVNLIIVDANNLSTRRGAYIHAVVSDGPADQAGLQGSSGMEMVDGLEVPVGGDVVIEADGQPVDDFSALLVAVSDKSPGDAIELTVLRDGERERVTVELAPRPSGELPWRVDGRAAKQRRR
jgi:2-alkenal reductase